MMPYGRPSSSHSAVIAGNTMLSPPFQSVRLRISFFANYHSNGVSNRVTLSIV